MKGIVLRLLKTLSSVACLCVLASLLFAPGKVSAFSAYGAGTTDNPYQISTCAQLQEMKDNLAGHYSIVSNIDCSGLSFIPIGTFSPLIPFTGSLEGNNHTITNFVSTDSGIFQYAQDASVRNLTIASGTITGGGNVGSFIGYAIHSSLSNVHSSATIVVPSPSSSAYIGGLVGGGTDATTIDGSSYSGIMGGGAYTGGLIGYLGNLASPSADVISNSYFDGTLTSSQVYVGALAGIFYSGTIRNSYSAGTIHINSGTNHVGGLVGLSYTGLTANNFSATLLDGTASYIGGMYGDFFVTTNSWNSTRSNNYYDQYRANGNDAYTQSCATLDEGSGNCTAVNSANAAPSYFKNNHTNAPLNHVSWDFTNTWQVTTGYPTLRNISNFIDPVVPNNGDANGDNTADSFQARVASVQNTGSVWSTIELPNSSGCTISNPAAIDAQSLKPDTGLMQQLSTMTSFEAYCPTAGMSTQATIIFDKLYDTSKSVLRHYNQTTNTYRTVEGAVFSTRVIGGITKTIVTYTITDGGVLDTDGISNGVIKDPVGFAMLPSPPSTGSSSPIYSTQYILAAISFTLLTAGALLARARQTARSY